ncbi:hypothetical protein G6011_11728 [Alternaria panax]|uniref:T6SS Phospholipase effector Tle1-like catalytic domain-containing protein n=1 Tax=Alternaria panax TaxID=48097 RepID=A0AAD4IEC6_9PLEO|nr:hypothetical protein G6011_11728 [Alternaria panax]
MPHSIDEAVADCTHVPRKLILCFDGTGNKFEGNTSDTNIVKLYDKFDRKDPNQYHYYQTGIGTYSVDGGPINKSFLGNIRSKISKAIDSGFATTFDAHVIAGYRFIMRYYKEGDKIYMFGFSRGAFTARFLARMISTVGLLSEGNEEMVPFAYDLYQQYEQGKLDRPAQKPKDPQATTGSAKAAVSNDESEPLLSQGGEADEQQLKKYKLDAFTATFCRSEGAANQPIKVHFLGLFDCVSSVAVLDSPFGKTPKAVDVVGTAHHIRHAVAADEHRVKFKAALLHQDKQHPNTIKESVKEVWFPGNHGDVGGGWPAPEVSEIKPKASWWRRVYKCLRSWRDDKSKGPDRELDPYQMSDVPLAWMIREVELIEPKGSKSAVSWSRRKDGFKDNFFRKLSEAYSSPMHDTLEVGGGASLFKVMLWNFMEWLPFRRWELRWSKETFAYKWDLISLPLNGGSGRDLPYGALLHNSLLERLHRDPNYHPSNTRGDDEIPCLTRNKDDFEIKQEEDKNMERLIKNLAEPAGIHNIWTFRGEGSVQGMN